MTITISTKESLYLVAGAFLLIGLVISVWAFRGGKVESDPLRTVIDPAHTTSVDPGSGLSVQQRNQLAANLPHPSCIIRLTFLLTRSPNYNGSNPYNLAFINNTGEGSANQPFSAFQDINGDSLPDYVYAKNYGYDDGTVVFSYHVACVYLNNGNGWTKAYECLASSRADHNGGVTGEYAGDCAGPPSKQ